MFIALDIKENKKYNVNLLDFQRNCFSIDNIYVKKWIDLDFDIDPYQGRYQLFFNGRRVMQLSHSGIAVE